MRKRLLQFSKIVASVALIYLAFRGIDFSKVIARLSQINIAWIVLAIGVALFQLWLGAVRWRIVTLACGTELPLSRAFRYNFIGAFFNQTLPSAIGGDAMRVVLLGRSSSDWRVATYSVFLDRAIGLIALALLVVVSLPLSWRLILSSHGRYGVIVIGLASLAAGMGFLLLGQLKWTWLNAWFPIRHLRSCSILANQILVGPSSFRIGVISISIHLLAVAMIWCVAQSITPDPQALKLFTLVPPVMLITMLPISIAGWGLRETSMMMAFRYAGLPEADGLIISLLFGAMTFVVGAVGGLVWILSSEKSVSSEEAERSEEGLAGDEEASSDATVEPVGKP